MAEFHSVIGDISATAGKIISMLFSTNVWGLRFSRWCRFTL